MITPLDQTIKGVMNLTWPMIVICVLLLSSIRLMDIFKNKKEFIFYKEVFSLVFMIYLPFTQFICIFGTLIFYNIS